LQVAYDELEVAIKAALAELKLEELTLQMSKIIQFYEATQNRMGVVVVGPSGCGKTTMWKVQIYLYIYISISIYI